MRRCLLALGAAFLIALAGGLTWKLMLGGARADRAVAETSSNAHPVPVTVGMAERRNVPVYLTGLGTVQAFNTVTINSRVDGELTKVAFTEGQNVNAGDVLAQIDPRSFQAALALADNRVRQRTKHNLPTQGSIFSGSRNLHLAVRNNKSIRRALW